MMINTSYTTLVFDEAIHGELDKVKGAIHALSHALGAVERQSLERDSTQAEMLALAIDGIAARFDHIEKPPRGSLRARLGRWLAGGSQ